ncbi:ABC-three component system middle component 2 [Leptospira interrogans]|uniref:ABC-three component system middle component 2 n=1 Tax=Leptospira interrogans TaxID=173 RepID=UPI00077486EF|nr:ABC-three component system middle component 2 [Leptospira interrogans]KAA1291464.1 threonine transporter [Leptospira interrogans serovar Geyaweera]
MGDKEKNNPFNTSFEAGIRSLVILNVAYPNALDLQRLVEFDYLALHSGDAGGPESLHAPLPLRSGELLIRRGVIELGLNLMISRNLIEKIPTYDGIKYLASDSAAPFVQSLASPYIRKLKICASWVIKSFGNATDGELVLLTRNLFREWTTQFLPKEETLKNSL